MIILQFIYSIIDGPLAHFIFLLLQLFSRTSLGAHVHEFLKDIYLGVIQLDCRVNASSVLLESTKLFSKVLVFTSIYCPSSIRWDFPLFHILVNIWYILTFKFLLCLVNVEWYLTVVLIYISVIELIFFCY